MGEEGYAMIAMSISTKRFRLTEDITQKKQEPFKGRFKKNNDGFCSWGETYRRISIHVVEKPRKRLFLLYEKPQPSGDENGQNQNEGWEVWPWQPTGAVEMDDKCEVKRTGDTTCELTHTDNKGKVKSWTFTAANPDMSDWALK